MGFFEILGIVFLGILAFNAAIGIWAIKTAKSGESADFMPSTENLHGLKISKV